jgi:hypothetical protein
LAVSTVFSNEGKYYLKLVNVLNHDAKVHLVLKDIVKGEQTCKRTLLSGAFDSTTARPTEDEIKLTEDCEYVMPAYSFTLIEIPSPTSGKTK